MAGSSACAPSGDRDGLPWCFGFLFGGIPRASRRDGDLFYRGTCSDGGALVVRRFRAEAEKERRIREAEGQAEAIRAVQMANAEGIRLKITEKYSIARGSEELPTRPVIIGFGPAGIFCAMALAEAGLKPLILERGSSVDNRVKAINRFYDTGTLNSECNIQFGAGGAGTFSDGKLTTRIGDHRCEYVLEKLHELGAPDDILWKAKPHIGTDILREVIKNADTRITALGGEIFYDTKVSTITDKYVITENGKIETGCIVVATGHSARDIYSMLNDNGFILEGKPFSVGVRVEHLQSDIDTALFGDPELSNILGHAEYQMSYRQGERGVYTFCMCPGGEVMAATSEEGGVVTNGMSRYARDGKNANSAVAVSVLPSDFGCDPMKAIEFQRSLEKKAFLAGGSSYAAPCQLMGNFLEGKRGDLKSTISPTYMNGKVVSGEFSELLPDFVSSLLKVGFRKFGNTIKGYDAKNVPLTGIETRTSAPVRILRNERLVALGRDNIYPCGEGAGYAGGIVSAAIDGIRCAEAIIQNYQPY